MANQEVASSPGLVHVQISLSQEAPKFREKIKRATKRHELVEVDDFVFRRKRHAIAPSPAAVKPAAADAAGSAPPLAGSSPTAAAAIKQGLQLEAPQPCAAAAARDNDAVMTDQADGPAAPCEAPPAAAAAAAESTAAEQQQAAAGPAQDVGLAAEAPASLQAAATPPPVAPAEAADPAALQFTVVPSELCDLVEWVFFNERKKVPGRTADAARNAAAQFKAQFAQLLQQHTAKAAEHQCEGGDTLAAPQLTVLPYLLEQQRAALEDKRAKLLQEEAHWLHLQEQYNDLHTPAAAEEGRVDPPTVADSDAATEGPAGAGASAAAGGAEAADVGGTPGTGGPPAAAKETAEPGAAAQGTAAMGPVCAEQAGKIRGVQLKVEMLVALVAKMEHLVSSAEAAARTLQAGYHSEKFKVFPHISSPAALIKSIISSQQAAVDPAIDGSS